MGSTRVSGVLDELVLRRNRPRAILADNGPEFASREMARWAYENDVQQHFIEPGKPVQNCFIESFNALLRDQCLNTNWFLSLQDARRLFDEWVNVYNHQRGHGSRPSQVG